MAQHIAQADFTSKPFGRRASVNERPLVTPRLSPMYIGISSDIISDKSVEIGFSVHDGDFTIDYSVQDLILNAHPSLCAQEIEDYIVEQLEDFSEKHLFKFVGAGITERLGELVPGLCGRLWKDLDMVPMIFKVRSTAKENIRAGLGISRQGSSVDVTKNLSNGSLKNGLLATVTLPKPPAVRPVDEQADSAVRKLVLHFNASHNPRLTIGYRNEVQVDVGQKVHLDGLDEYRRSVREPTWNAVMKYAEDLRNRGVKIGFFSSTPQGGGVALMRHALIRFFNLVGVDAKWYVPKPSPAVFRTTKNNHNIMQGVADPNLRLTKEKEDEFSAWITYNAERYWIADGGPLAPGGVDVAFIDDPQMPGLIPLIKKRRPELPIVYRSHIEIRSDLINQSGSPQSEVWDYLWNRIKGADLFISHPVPGFVPSTVPLDTVGLLPASTDWLDGLGKPMREWDLEYYMRLFRTQCIEAQMAELQWPQRPYVVQIARFDPAKGIPIVIDSYVKMRHALEKTGMATVHTPQLLLCGHGAIDDPDASIIYDMVTKLLEEPQYISYINDIVVMRIGPSDQMLNALMTNAKIVLQLSSREGFEVKVSEALHHGKPIIATLAGGIPLQVQDGKNGFLCAIDDSEAVSQRLFELWTDNELYKRLSDYAKVSVSDEVGTLGNAASWMYLASKLSKGEKLVPNLRWINDMMREDVGEPYGPDEPRLPRDLMKLKK